MTASIAEPLMRVGAICCLLPLAVVMVGASAYLFRQKRYKRAVHVLIAISIMVMSCGGVYFAYGISFEATNPDYAVSPQETEGIGVRYYTTNELLRGDVIRVYVASGEQMSVIVGYYKPSYFDEDMAITLFMENGTVVHESIKMTGDGHAFVHIMDSSGQAPDYSGNIVVDQMTGETAMTNGGMVLLSGIALAAATYMVNRRLPGPERARFP